MSQIIDNKQSVNDGKNSKLQVGCPLLHPSPNWFSNCAIDTRAADHLLASASFKTIVVFHVDGTQKLPVLIKSISHQQGKVNHVRLHPRLGAPHQHCLVATGEYGSITLYDTRAGARDHVIQHNQHKNNKISAACWVVTEENAEFVVSVDGSGIMVVWDLLTNLTRRHSITTPHPNHNNRTHVTNLTMVEPIPGTTDCVLVADEKSLLIINIKSGQVLSTLRGHDYPVYCIRWFSGTGSPLLSRGRPSAGNSSSRDNWRDQSTVVTASADDAADSDPSPPAREGLFFASSDIGRNVLLWDVTAQRYVAKTALPARKGAQERPKGKVMPQHVGLAWYGDSLIMSSPGGEVLTVIDWGSPKEGSSWGKRGKSNEPNGEGDVQQHKGLNTINTRLVHREHNRAIYNIHVMGNIVISYSQDRKIVAFCLESQKVIFSMPTLGTTINNMNFCPHDSSWLTLGMQESSIRMVNLHSKPSFKSKSFFNDIKGKVLAMSWNIEEEGKLLFGTGDGQVGVVDANSGRSTSFAFFHQKPVYKVEWAPAVLVDQFPNLRGVLCAYSFGDREIVMRNPRSPMEDPVKLTKVHDTLPSNISEFSFSLDSNLLAIGCQDGTVTIHRTSDLAELVRLSFVRKNIQHLLWKPCSSENENCDKTLYTLIIASSDTKICIMEFGDVIQTQLDILSSKSTGSADTEVTPYEPMILTSCTRELAGHSSRVVWLSYSTNNSEILASASYDHTCQIWNIKTGEHLGNYRGHLSRVFRVEFSPDDADLLYSFAEENCLHSWRISELVDLTPPEKIIKPVAEGNKQKLTELIETPSTDNSSRDSKGTAARTAVSAAAGSIRPRNTADREKVGEASGVRRMASHKSLFPMLHAASSHKRGFILMALLCMNEDNKLMEEYKALQDEKDLEDLIDEGMDGSSDVPPPPPIEHYPQVLANQGSVLLETDQTPPPNSDMATYLNFYGRPTNHTSFVRDQIKDHTVIGNSVSSFILSSFVGSLDQHIRAAAEAKKLTPHLVAQAAQVSRSLQVMASEAYGYQLAEDGDPLLGSTYLVNANKITDAVQLLLTHKMPREALTLAKCRLPYDTEVHTNVTRAFAATATYEGNFDLAATLFTSLGDLTTAASTLCRRGDCSSLMVAGLLYQQAGKQTIANATLLEAIKLAAVKGLMDKVESVILQLPQFKWFLVVNNAQRHLSAWLEKGGESGVGVLAKLSSTLPADSQHVYQQLLQHLSTSQHPLTLKQMWHLVSVEVCKLLLFAKLGADEQKQGEPEQHLQCLLTLLQDWGRKDVVTHVTRLLLPEGVGSPPPFLSLLFSANSSSVSLLCRLYHISECSISLDRLKFALHCSDCTTATLVKDTTNTTATLVKDTTNTTATGLMSTNTVDDNNVSSSEPTVSDQSNTSGSATETQKSMVASSSDDGLTKSATQTQKTNKSSSSDDSLNSSNRTDTSSGVSSMSDEGDSQTKRIVCDIITDLTNNITSLAVSDEGGSRIEILSTLAKDQFFVDPVSDVSNTVDYLVSHGKVHKSQVEELCSALSAVSIKPICSQTV